MQVDEKRLLLAKGYGVGSKLIEVDSTDWSVKTQWKSNRLKTKFTTAVLKDGYAYGLSDGILECIDVETGARQWKRGRYRHGQLLLLDDHLLISAEQGDLVLVEANPKKHIELSTIPVITDVSWNTLALSGDRLLMRNSEYRGLCNLANAQRVYH